MSIRLLRLSLFCLMLLAFPLLAYSAGATPGVGNGGVAGNSVGFDPPLPGGLNPDSPAAGAITATGFTTSAMGWSCTKIEVTVTELATLKQVDYKASAGAATWKYAETGFNKGTHVVSAQASWSDGGSGVDSASTSQTVTVK